MQITVQNLKDSPFPGREGLAYQCTVCIDGKPAFTATDRGDGGMMWYDPIGPLPAEAGPALREAAMAHRSKVAEAEAFAKSMPPIETEYGPMSCSLDLLVASLCDEYASR